MGFNILDLFLPREVEFFRMMNRQSDILVQCARTFDRLLGEIDKLSEEEIAERLRVLKELETTGDEVERSIIEKLHTSFITPIEREDIHALVTSLDNAIDSINGTAKKVEVYGLRRIPESIFHLSRIILDGSTAIQDLMANLEKKNSVKEAAALIKKVHDQEKEADMIFHESMAAIFKTEKDAAVMIMHKEVYERLEGTTDLLDHIAKTVRGVVVKQG